MFSTFLARVAASVPSEETHAVDLSTTACAKARVHWDIGSLKGSRSFLGTNRMARLAALTCDRIDLRWLRSSEGLANKFAVSRARLARSRQ